MGARRANKVCSYTHQFAETSEHSSDLLLVLILLEPCVEMLPPLKQHRLAYELGVIHRDISEGNVMMARRSARFRGFIQDFDYSFSWRQFLRKREMEISLAGWEQYCKEHGHKPRASGNPDESKERTVSHFLHPGGEVADVHPREPSCSWQSTS